MAASGLGFSMNIVGRLKKSVRNFKAARSLKAARPLQLGLACLAIGAVGCGAEFDSPTKVSSLRVLGVQKDQPYPQPGEELNLSILWHDNSAEAPRPVQVAWFSGCFNPPGDNYYGCYQSLAEGFQAFDAGQPLPPGFAFGRGEQFNFTIPADIISSRPPSGELSTVPYGLAYVFFAVCAGEFGAAPKGQAFPLACFAADGSQIGADGFVAGYTSTYVYDGIRNKNPVIEGFELNKQAVSPDCIGQACIDGSAQEPDASATCGAGITCIDACEADGDIEDCPEIELRPLIPSSVVELDEVANASEGRNFKEQMWVNYYSEAGEFRSPVRLLSDAQSGWNEDYGAIFFAPKQSGDIKIWAVAHDNRGGAEWVRVTVRVR